ncbi:MAG: hypothetical protein WC829_02875 [Hyphomicrobium sp.]|jgi:hypothetical protein
MTYKAEGYKGTGVGPIMVPKIAAPDMSTVNTLNEQAYGAADPTALQFLAALEERYARDTAAAQQPVQTAATSGSGSILPYEHSPDQMAAIAARRRMELEAAQRYNAALPAGDPRAKDIMRWDL